MAKKKNENIDIEKVVSSDSNFTGVAVASFKVGELLADSVELQIEDGIVIGTKRLCRGSDLPSMAIANAVRRLWSTYKTQKGKPQ